MIKIKRDKVTSLVTKRARVCKWLEIRSKESYLFGLIEKEGGLFDNIWGCKVPLPDDCFIKDDVVYYKPCAIIRMIDRRIIEIPFDTIEQCKAYIKRVEACKEIFFDPYNF
jgi:hypothetical protein